MKFNTLFIVKLCSLLFICCFGHELLAQLNSEDTDFEIKQIAKTPTFSTPEASSFSSESMATINFFNGSLNVNVPLYTITSHHLTVPVTVNYNCNGIKVNDVSTRVGTGWMLNSGGAVTRTMFGRPDELGMMVNLENVNWNDPLEAIAAMQVNCSGEGSDSQYDLFSYSYPGGSGKLAFDMNWNPFLIPQNDDRIEVKKNGVEIEGFVITGIDGLQYHFFAVEKTTVLPLSGEAMYDHDVPTAWYLTKIKHPLGDSICFYYSNPGIYGYTVGKVYTRTYKFPHSYSSCVCESGYDSKIKNQSYTISPCRLDSIVSVTGSMNFTYEGLGPTVLPKERLSQITVNNISNDEFIHFNLFHSISGDRIFLDSIIKSSLNENFPPHAFDYIQKSSMPVRLINSQDEFGYFNGKNNSTLLSRLDGEYFGLFNSFTKADRSYSFSHALVGLLQKVTYPTGGYNVIDYEPHHSNQAIYSTHYTENVFGPISVSNPGGNGGSVGVITTSFSVSETGFVKLWMKKEIDVVQNDTKAIFTIDDTLSYSLDCYNSVCEDSIFWFLEGGDHILTITAMGHADLVICTATANIYSQETDSIPVYPEYGIRVKRITNYPGGESQPSVQRVYYTPYNDTSTSSLMPVILPTHFSESKHYKSCLISNSNSIITIVCGSVVWHDNSIIEMLPFGNDFAYHTVTLSNGEYFENGGTQYTFFARRNSAGQVLVPPNELVDCSMNQRNWINGTKITETTFDKNLDLVRKTTNIYSECNDQILNNYDIRQICPGYEGFHNPEDRLLDYAAQKSQYYSIWLKLNNVVTIEYFNEANTSITKTADFYYDDSESKQVTKEEVTTSEGSQITEIFYPTMFSQSGTSGAAAAISEMKNQHIINKAIETVQSIKYPNMTEPSVIDSQVNMYKIDDDVVIPDKVHKLESVLPIPESDYQYSSINGSGQFQYDNRVIEQVKYDLFDETGNLIQYHEINNIPVTFIWGYNYNYPIAKIDNATFDEVVNTLIAINNNYTIEYLQNLPENELITIFNLLRAHINMSDALVTSYTHQMLKGISSSTDPDGKTTYYEYDPFGRLETVRDQNIHTIKHIEYNYSNSENKRR